MLKNLTDKQINKMPEYVQKFLSLGLSTKQLDDESKEDVKKNMAAIYKVAKLEAPKFYIFLDSPMACLYGYVYFEELMKQVGLVGSQVESQVWSQVRSQVESQVRSQVGSQVWSQVESQVRSQVGSQVWSQVESQVGSQVWSQVESQVWSQVESQVGSQVESQVGSQVWSQVESQVRSQVGSQVWSQVESQVGSQVWSQVESQVWSQVESQVGSQRSNFCWGSQDAGWLSYYSFFLNETDVKNLEIIKPLIDLVGKCSFYLPYKDVVFISSNPTAIHMTNGRLHNTQGVAWSYSDGFCGYSLDGIPVTKEIIDAVKGQVAPESVLKVQNVEQRLVAVKYVGPERLIKHLNGKVLDTKGTEYVLHSLTLEGIDCRMLEMQNPSEDKRHYEFVPPEVNTVNKALAWRLGWDSFKEPVTKT